MTTTAQLRNNNKTNWWELARVGWGGQTVENLARVGRKFELDQTQTNSSQLKPSACLNDAMPTGSKPPVLEHLVGTLVIWMLVFCPQRVRLSEVKRQEQELLENQSIPLRNYLMKHVMPTLTQGLIEACKIRPDDPIDFVVSCESRHMCLPPPPSTLSRRVGWGVGVGGYLGNSAICSRSAKLWIINCEFVHMQGWKGHTIS